MQRKNIHKQWLICMVISCLLIAIALYLLLVGSKVEKEDTYKILTPIYASKLVKKNNVPTSALYGYVQVPAPLLVKAAIKADVKDVFAKVGDKVEQGQVLVILNEDEHKRNLLTHKEELNGINSQINKAMSAEKADLAAIEHEKDLLAIGNTNLERFAKLKESKVISNIEYENAQKETKSHQLALNQREKQLAVHKHTLLELKSKKEKIKLKIEQSNADFLRTKVSSPVSGFVTEVFITKGSQAQAMQQLVKIIPEDGFQVRAQLPNKFYQQVQSAIKNNNKLAAKLYGEGFVDILSLDRIVPEVKPGSIGKEVIFSFKSSEYKLNYAYQMPVFIMLDLPAVKDSYSLPLSAFYYNNKFIYTVDKDSSLAIKEIENKGSLYIDNQPWLIFTSEQDLSESFAMTNHLPQAVSGMQVRIVGGESE